MPTSRLAVVILAAGKGTRMRSDLPKVLHKLAGRSMLRHVIATAEALEPAKIVVVVASDMKPVAEAARPHVVAIQERQLGTGDAVAAALRALAEVRPDEVLVLYGDTPLITAETLQRLLDERRRTDAAAVVLGLQASLPTAYGRLILDEAGALLRIVEAKDASEAELAVDLCNSGVMAIDGGSLAGLLGRLDTNNANGEYYLTDIVAVAREDGRVTRAVLAPIEELVGINSRAEQAAAEAILQSRLREAAMTGGATLIDPSTVWFAADTVVGRDVTIGPCVTFGPGVTIEDGVEIKPYCHIEGALVRRGAIIGPFARLRPGSEIGRDAHIGNFVELKNTRLGDGAKANHLAYLGDADIGARSNIGAGTITCNYDGFFKDRTVIGNSVFIGSNSALVAPVTIGDRAMVAAGSVVTNDVAADATAIARARQLDLPGHSARFRERQAAVKAGRKKEKE